MTEANRTNIRLKIPGDRKNKPLVIVPLTLAEVIDWIKAQPYDENTKHGLITKASAYPGQALRTFMKDIDQHINSIVSKRQEKE